MMDRVAGGDDYMLYALLNGGAPYLIRDAAYAGMDGDMNAALRARTENDIERCAVVAGLHRASACRSSCGMTLSAVTRWCSARFSPTGTRRDV